MMLPVNNLSTIVTPVLHPVLADFQNKPEIIYGVSKKITKLFGMLGIPASIFLYFSASEIIKIFFGNQWGNSVLPFQYLALAVWIHMIHSGAMSIFLSLNRTNYLFITTLISTIFIVTAIICGIFILENIAGVAILIALAYLFNMLQVYYILVVRILKKDFLDYFSSLKTGFLIGISVLIFNLIIYFFLTIENIYLAFFIKLGVTLIAFISVLLLLNEYKGLIDLIRPSKVKLKK